MRFSVVIPCYNQGTFLDECVASLARQTLPPHEVILVDDGSTDAYTVARIDELGRDHRVVRQPNRGLSAARNAGVSAASGDWIVPLDSDDELTPEALAAYAAAIAGEPDVAIWYPDIQQFGLDDTLHHMGPPNPWRLLWANRMVCSSAIRREVFETVRYNERMRRGYEDWEFYVHACCERGFRAERLRRPVFRYRRWGYSMVLETDRVRPAVIAQLQAERPIYDDPQALLALKRRHEPHLAVAARSTRLQPSLRAQSLQDFRLIDEEDRVLATQSLAVAQPGVARLLVSLDDDALAAAFSADAWLLEKLARAFARAASPLVWLVATDDEAAAMTVPPPHARVVGLMIGTRAFFERRLIPATSAGLLADLLAWAQAGGTPAPWLSLGRAQSGGLEASELAPPAEAQGRLRVIGAGRSASQLVRTLIGPAAHDALWRNPVLQGLQRALDRGRAQPETEIPTREGPIARDADAALLADLDLALREPMRLSPGPPGDPPLIVDSDQARAGEASFRLALFEADGDPLATLVTRVRPSKMVLVGLQHLESLPRVRALQPRLEIVVQLSSLPADDRLRLARVFNLVDRFEVLGAALVDALRALYVSPSRIVVTP